MKIGNLSSIKRLIFIRLKKLCHNGNFLFGIWFWRACNFAGVSEQLWPVGTCHITILHLPPSLFISMNARDIWKKPNVYCFIPLLPLNYLKRMLQFFFRHFKIHPSGEFLVVALQDSGKLEMYRIDLPSG